MSFWERALALASNAALGPDGGAATTLGVGGEWGVGWWGSPAGLCLELQLAAKQHATAHTRRIGSIRCMYHVTADETVSEKKFGSPSGLPELVVVPLEG